MKKLLALALAAILLLGTIPAASAEFKDQNDVSFMTREAVEIMSDLKVVSGFPDGAFKPEDTLTRAQAAKILCCVALGTKAADELSATGSTFSDVPASHWANKFVEFCASKGIVAGVGNGKFNPDGKLTGYAFGKMLLVALGADASTLTGAEWDKNTKAQLVEKHLHYGVTPSNEELSRQDACRLALNAMFYGEGEDADSTLAYKNFGVTRASKGNDVTRYRRPFVNYISDNEDAYWEGTEKKITASPVLFKKTGFYRAADILKALNVDDISIGEFDVYRNGAKGVFKDEKNNHLHKGDTKNYYISGDGTRLEFYFAADTQKWTIIHLFYFPLKIKDVTKATYYTDGTLENPGSVTFENGWSCSSNEFTEDDIGTYACVYGTNNDTMNKITAVREAFRGTIIEGTLTDFGKETMKLDGKEYVFPSYPTTTAEVKQYLNNGGAIGDKVKVLLTDDNLALMIWKAE